MVLENTKNEIGKLLKEVIFNSRMEGDFHFVYESDMDYGGCLRDIDIPQNLREKDVNRLDDEGKKQISKGIHKRLCQLVSEIDDIEHLNSIKELIIKSQKVEKISYQLVGSINEFEKLSGKDLGIDKFDVWDVPTDCVFEIVEKIKE